MGSSIPLEGRIFIDELTIYAIKGFIRNPLIKEVIVLDKIKSVQLIFQLLLKIRGLSIREASFLMGELRDQHGESVRPAARKIAGKLALVFSSEILKKNAEIRFLNGRYGRNTIALYIAKKSQLLIEPWIVRSLVASSLSQDGAAVVYLRKPCFFESQLLTNFFQESNIDIKYYPKEQLGIFGLILFFLKDFLSEFKLRLQDQNSPIPKNYITNEKPLVLMLQEEHIRQDMSYRNQFHWVDEAFLKSSNIGVVRMFGANFMDGANSFESLDSSIYIFNRSIFHYAYSLVKENNALRELRNSRTQLLKKLFGTKSNIERYWILNVAILLRKSELIGAVSLFTKAKVFLIKEPQNVYADALQLISSDIGVTTIAYQYSNLGLMSPLMLSTADKFILFSEMYATVFSTADIRANEYIMAGYVMDGIAPLVAKRAQNLRAELGALGAKFIICFFDESVSSNKWLNVITKEDHLAEIHILARSVIDDLSIGVIIKSQFMYNSPSRLYPNDKLITLALQSGRFVELSHGSHRNDIYPTEAALSADFCIGHKSGATAALESATLGVRTALLNPYGHKVFFDNILSKVKVEYDSLANLMGAIKGYRSENLEESALGDWAPVLHYFHPQQKYSSIERLRSIIHNSVLN
jgi:hypothetical protein